MNQNVRNWLETLEYLPPDLRDFHAQKEVFKWIWEKVEANREAGAPAEPSQLRDMDWAAAHVWTVDWFLWFMAACGYTLQRSRKKGVPFHDLTACLAEKREREVKAFDDMLAARTKRGEGTK